MSRSPSSNNMPSPTGSLTPGSSPKTSRSNSAASGPSRAPTTADLETLLGHKVYGPIARAYLAKRQVGDALEGYDAVKAYRNTGDKPACFTRLVNTYCVQGAPKQLNVSAGLMQRLNESDPNDIAQLDGLVDSLLEELRRTLLTAFTGSGSTGSTDDPGPEIMKDCMLAVERRRNESVRGKLENFFKKRGGDKDADRKVP
jgi:hypothetical protein